MTTTRSTHATSSRFLSPKFLGLLIATGTFVLLLALPTIGRGLPGLDPLGHRMLAIFLSAIVLWITEAIPLHATSALVILLEVLLISDKALAAPAVEGLPPYRQFFATLADPILMLFLGGFFLADGAAKYELDQNLARVMLKPFGDKPRNILLGMLLITAVFSMFMSNTATTATMMMVVLPVIQQLPPGDRLRPGLALAIPVAANIGGIGTPVGTPPNAIALGALAKHGVSIGFTQWMVMAVPFMLVILAAAWVLFLVLFRSQQRSVRLTIGGTFITTRPAKIYYATAAATLLLWFTEELHGISANIVGFLPVVVLLATGVFTGKDLQAVEWPVLWLVAGGIALGTGVGTSGLDKWMVGLVSWEHLSPAVLAGAMALAALVMGTFMSHSATTNLLVPLGISLATSGAVSISAAVAGVFIAIGSSLAMALPISTPPNAIAMSTGAVKTKDMALVGVIIGILGWLAFAVAGPWWWRLAGVMPQ